MDTSYSELQSNNRHFYLITNSTLNREHFHSPRLVIMYIILHLPFFLLAMLLWSFYIAILKTGCREEFTQTLPIKIYKKKDKLETCSICLEKLINFDNVRILKCKHVFHVDCIDIWIYKRLTCPMCRDKMFLKNKIIWSD